jgi:hypothetical protein
VVLGHSQATSGTVLNGLTFDTVAATVQDAVCVKDSDTTAWLPEFFSNWPGLVAAVYFLTVEDWLQRSWQCSQQQQTFSRSISSLNKSPN